MKTERNIYFAGSRRKIFPRMCFIVTIAVISLFLSSCTTKAARRAMAVDKAWRSNDFAAMIETIKGNTKTYGQTNAFLFNMDLGVLYHYIGEYETSNEYLLKAADIYDELFTKSVTNEAAALLTNDNVRPYRAKPYELVTLHQLAAFNFMAQGKFEEALVETRKVQIHFNEWERTAGKGKSAKYHTDGMSHLFSSLAYEAQGEADNSLISLYKAVQAYNLGPVPLPKEVAGFAYNRLNAGGRENDVVQLGIAPKGDLNGWDVKQGASEIIIVGYAGRGPNLKDLNFYGTFANGGQLYLTVPVKHRRDDMLHVTIAMPAPPLPPNKAGGAGTLTIKVSLPDLRTNTALTSHFTAQIDGGQSVRSVVVNNYDLQAKKALEDAWTDIVMRTVVRVVLRTIAAEQTKKATKSDNALLNIVASVGTDIAAAQLEQADVRMCFILPKNVQMMRLPVEPGTHNVTLNAYDKNRNVIESKTFENVTVKRGEKKMLFHSVIE